MINIKYNKIISFGKFKGMNTKQLLESDNSIFNVFLNYLRWIEKSTDIDIDNKTITILNTRIQHEKSKYYEREERRYNSKINKQHII